MCVVSQAKDHVCRGGNTLLQENPGRDKKAATDWQMLSAKQWVRIKKKKKPLGKLNPLEKEGVKGKLNVQQISGKKDSFKKRWDNKIFCSQIGENAKSARTKYRQACGIRARACWVGTWAGLSCLGEQFIHMCFRGRCSPVSLHPRSHTAENRATSIAVCKVQGVYRPDGRQERRVESRCRGSVLFLLFRKLDIQSNIR